MAPMGYTQAQYDALLAAYAKGQIRGSVAVEGRSLSWDYGSRESMKAVLAELANDLATQSGTGRKRFTFASFDRGYRS